MFELTAGRLQLDINSLLVKIYIYIQTAMLGTREYTLCSPFRANAHNSSFIQKTDIHIIHVDDILQICICNHIGLYVVFRGDP